MIPQTFQYYLAEQKIGKGLVNVLVSLTDVFPVLAGLLKGAQKGYLQSQNVYGEKQLAIDVQSNKLFLEVLQKNVFVSSIASEELESEEKGSAVHGEESYAVAFDPLDGSSLIDVNQAVGSIFGIYKGSGFIGKMGSEQVAALIVVYGPRLTFSLTLGQGTLEFRYDEDEHQFVLSGKLELLDEKKMFAPGNLRACSSETWYMQLLQFWVMNGYTLRYSGGMVPDVNQILRKGGGIFAYPGYKEQPQGKLRLLYECAPMAFLIEQAGGSTMTWLRDEVDPVRLLDVTIEKLDQRIPIFLGSKKEVQKVLEYCLQKK